MRFMLKYKTKSGTVLTSFNTLSDREDFISHITVKKWNYETWEIIRK